MSNTIDALPLPPAVPQFRQNLWRRLAARAFHACGWRVQGRFPNESRVVLIAAPHSSWWDGVWALLLKIALGVDVSFMGKRELFIGPLGWVLRRLGGIPIERTASHGLVEQFVERLRATPRMWVGIAPEGTRKRGGRWRSGFWHIAHTVGVPILPVHFDYPSKTIGIGPLFHTTDDMSADIAGLLAYYGSFRGKHHNV
ncbi:MAG: 1-acyl-sn-glycerol-3-phosphate acyltransferase [Dokdonella sp.]